mmetsp:Transcript_45718/g.87918  ORF Transcript_45718/g.87918 Transcript_45718/m.87918 type:complete len:219 (-) Transcript_45718:2325-2981(-)
MLDSARPQYHQHGRSQHGQRAMTSREPQTVLLRGPLLHPQGSLAGSEASPQMLQVAVALPQPRSQAVKWNGQQQLRLLQWARPGHLGRPMARTIAQNHPGRPAQFVQLPLCMPATLLLEFLFEHVPSPHLLVSVILGQCNVLHQATPPKEWHCRLLVDLAARPDSLQLPHVGLLQMLPHVELLQMLHQDPLHREIPVGVIAGIAPEAHLAPGQTPHHF